MKKSIVLMAVLGIVLLAAACNRQPAPSQDMDTVIAVVDSNRVMLESDPGQSAMDYLRGLSMELQGELQGMQGAMDQNQTEEAAQLLQEKFAASQERMGAEQNRIIAILNNAYEQLLEDYRDEHGISVILSQESAISYSESADITEDIIAAMNELDIDLQAAVEGPAAFNMNETQ